MAIRKPRNNKVVKFIIMQEKTVKLALAMLFIHWVHPEFRHRQFQRKQKMKTLTFLHSVILRPVFQRITLILIIRQYIISRQMHRLPYPRSMPETRPVRHPDIQDRT